MKACPLCSDPPLAQAAIHFERSWWEAVKAEAQAQVNSARLAIKKADAHLARVANTPVGGGAHDR